MNPMPKGHKVAGPSLLGERNAWGLSKVLATDERPLVHATSRGDRQGNRRMRCDNWEDKGQYFACTEEEHTLWGVEVFLYETTS